MPPSSYEPTPEFERTQAASADQAVASATRSASSAPAGFELRDEVGRGGMGVVYRALDLSLGREVAVKLLQDQFPATGTTAARFLDEARITAQLQHPGIPAVHQVGLLPTGRPFLAMKLIKGDTLDRMLKFRTDVAEERSRYVGIFEAIAQALAYAHSHRVIHRDLKPANVMVGAFAEVQVMDWGLAKVLGESTAKTAGAESNETTKIHSDRDSHSDASTQYGQFMGTPAYMPPEQAIGAVDRIDERSDVFGLGAILCVILTGKPPFVGDDAETTRQLAARGKIEDAFARLDSCGAEPELVALAKRCLAVEPADRPANAGWLAAAVAAYRASAEERARNLEVARVAGAARRRILARAAVALIAVLAAGVGVSAWQAVRATKAERDTAEQLALTKAAEAKEHAARTEADEKREEATKEKVKALERKAEAERQQRKAEAVKSFLQEMISQASPWNVVTKGGTANPNMTVRQALDAAIASKFDPVKNDPLIEAELREAFGLAYYDMAEYTKAELHFRRAIELQRELVGAEPADLLALNVHLGDTLRKLGRLDEADEWVGRCADARLKTLGLTHEYTLNAVRSQADIASDRGQYDKAEKLYRNLRAAWQKTFGAEHRTTLSLGMHHADSLRCLGRFDEAKAIIEPVVAEWEKVAGPKDPNTLFAVNELSMILESEGSYDRAVPLFDRAVAGLTESLGPEHHETLIARQNRGSFLRHKGDLAKAETELSAVLAIRRRVYGEEHPNTLFSRNHLGLTYAAMGDAARAEPHFRAAVDGLSKVFGPNHLDTLSCKTNLADFYKNGNRLAEAEPLNVEILRAKENLFGPNDPETLYAANNLALLRYQQGRYPEAEKLYLRAVAGLRKAFGDAHPEPQQAMTNLADLYRNTSDYAKAEPLYVAVLDARQKSFGDDHYQTTVAKNNLGTLREAQGRYAEAERLFRDCIDGHERRLGPNADETTLSLYNLGYVFMSQNRPADAEPWFAKSYAGRLARYGFANGSTLLSVNYLLLALEGQGKFAEAAPLLRKLLEYREKNEPNVWTTANTRSRLGRALLDVGLPDEARKLALAGFEELKAKESVIPPFYRGLRLREAAGRLVKIFELTGSDKDAAKWRAIESTYRELAPVPRVRN